MFKPMMLSLGLALGVAASTANAGDLFGKTYGSPQGGVVPSAQHAMPSGQHVLPSAQGVPCGPGDVCDPCGIKSGLKSCLAAKFNKLGNCLPSCGDPCGGKKICITIPKVNMPKFRLEKYTVMKTKYRLVKYYEDPCATPAYGHGVYPSGQVYGAPQGVYGAGQAVVSPQAQH